MLFFPHRDPVIEELKKTLELVEKGDPATMDKIAEADGGELANMSPEQRQQFLANEIKASIEFAKQEPHPPGASYHSRDPLAGLVQSSLGDKVLPRVQAFGQGNPIVWIPAGIDGILERYRGKAAFKAATAKSKIVIPPKCKIGLLADWGADNEHAKRIGELAIEKGAEYLIHLGDIYYSGTSSECQSFVNRWPLRGEDNKPKAGYSFALNGNHEMYSLGRYYFTTVLDGFGQEASYFTLLNDWWQIHGLDTAYVPFSIDGGAKDARLKVQWDWLVGNLQASPQKKNIFLSHNQPVSAHIPEFAAAGPLMEQWSTLATATQRTDFAFAWFFGHEHRCTIYDDTKTRFKARLIGNGSIPHPPQTETGPQVAPNGASTTPIFKVNHGALGSDVAISTFAMLTFDGAECVAEYVNEDGTTFYKELLSGDPNNEIDS